MGDDARDDRGDGGDRDGARPAEADPRDPLAGEYRPVPFVPEPVDPREAVRRQEACLASMRYRRSVRAFSRRPVDRRLVETAIATAGTAPSGAHAQPWTFVVVGDPAVKARIRAAAEAEEARSYAERMPDEWQVALRRLGTDAEKTHLTDAPWIVVVFARGHHLGPDGFTRRHYYVTESVSIAVGLFLASCQQAGLATLTHTPSPMGFLTEALGRPANERPLVVIPVGHPAPDATVPDLDRKPLDDIMVVV